MTTNRIDTDVVNTEVVTTKKFNLLLSLPVELRLYVYDYILDDAGKNYIYLSTEANRPLLSQEQKKNRPPLRRHAMLLVSRQLSAEYVHGYYSKCQFFFYIDPRLHSSKPLAEQWALPPALVAGMSRCKIFVDAPSRPQTRKEKLAGSRAAKMTLLSRTFELVEAATALREVQLVVSHVLDGGDDGAANLPALWLAQLKELMPYLQSIIVVVSDYEARQKKVKGVWVDVGSPVDGYGRYIHT